MPIHMHPQSASPTLANPCNDPNFPNQSVVAGQKSLTTPAVWGVHCFGGVGVQGLSNAGIGVRGDSSSVVGVFGSSDKGDGVQGRSAAAKHAGVTALNSGNGFGLWAKSQGGAAGYFEGNVTITGLLTANHCSLSGEMTVQPNGDITFADCAEDFEIAGSLSVDPGTVMSVGDEGLLVPCAMEYDTRVAGIISGAGHLRPAIILGRQRNVSRSVPIALVGKVFCKIDADQCPVRAGDLLTTSPTPGHAMVVRERSRALGAVIGKALQPLAEGRGIVPVLVCSR